MFGKQKDQYVLEAQRTVMMAFDATRKQKPVNKNPYPYPGCMINSAHTEKQMLDCFVETWPHNKCEKCYHMWKCIEVYEMVGEELG